MQLIERFDNFHLSYLTLKKRFQEEELPLHLDITLFLYSMSKEKNHLIAKVF